MGDFDALTRLGIVIGASVDRPSVQKAVREVQEEVQGKGGSGSPALRAPKPAASGASPAQAKNETDEYARSLGNLARQTQAFRNQAEQFRTAFSKQINALQTSTRLTERLGAAQKRLGATQGTLKNLVEQAATTQEAGARKALAAQIRLERARASAERAQISAISSEMARRGRLATAEAQSEEKSARNLLNTKRYWAGQQARYLEQRHSQALRENQRRDRETARQANQELREEERRQQKIISTRTFWARQRQQYLDRLHREALAENARRDRETAQAQAKRQAAPGQEFSRFQQRFAQVTNRMFRWYVMFTAAFWSLSMVARPFMQALSWVDKMLGRLAQEAVRFGQAFLNSVIRIQNLEGRMRVFFGPSTSRAIQWAIDEALGKPFEWTQLSEAMIRAMALGIDKFPKAAFGQVMRAAEDLAAAFQRPVQDMVAGIMLGSTGNFRRLIQLGFRPSMAVQYGGVPGATGERLRYSTPEDRLRNLNAIVAMIEGRVGGAAEKLSYTWAAMLEDMKDSWARFTLGLQNQGFLNPLLASLGTLRQKFLEMRNDGTFDQWAAEITQSVAWLRGPLAWLTERVPGIASGLIRLGTMGATALGKWYDKLGGIPGILSSIRTWFQQTFPLGLRLVQAMTAAFGVAITFMVDLVKGMGHLVALLARVGELVGKVRPGTADTINAGIKTVQKLENKYLTPGPNGAPSPLDRVQDWLGQLADRAERAQGAKSADEYLRTVAPGLAPVADAYRAGKMPPGSYDLELKTLSANPQNEVGKGLDGLQATDEEGFSELGDQVDQAGDKTSEAVQSSGSSIRDILGQIRDTQRNYLRGEVGHKSYTGHPFGVTFGPPAAAAGGDTTGVETTDTGANAGADTGTPPASGVPITPFAPPPSGGVPSYSTPGSAPAAATPYPTVTPAAATRYPTVTPPAVSAGRPPIRFGGYAPPAVPGPTPHHAVPWSTRAYRWVADRATGAEAWTRQHLGDNFTTGLEAAGIYGLWRQIRKVPYAAKQLPGWVWNWGRAAWNRRFGNGSTTAEAAEEGGEAEGLGSRVLGGLQGAWGAVRGGVSTASSWLRGGGLGRFWNGGVNPETNYGQRAVESARAWRAARAAQSLGEGAEAVADTGEAARAVGWLARAAGWLGRFRGLSAISKGAGRILGPLGVATSAGFGVSDALHTWHHRQGQPWYAQMGWSLYDSAKAFGGGLLSGGPLGGVIAGGASTLTKIGEEGKALWNLGSSWLANRRANAALAEFDHLTPAQQATVRRLVKQGQSVDAAIRVAKLTPARVATSPAAAWLDRHNAWEAYQRAHTAGSRPGVGEVYAPGKIAGFDIQLAPGHIRSDAEILAGMDRFGNYPTLPMGVATTPIKTANGYFIPLSGGTPPPASGGPSGLGAIWQLARRQPLLEQLGGMFPGASDALNALTPGGQGAATPAMPAGRPLSQFVPVAQKLKHDVNVAVQVLVKPSKEFEAEYSVNTTQRDMDEGRGLFRA